MLAARETESHEANAEQRNVAALVTPCAQAKLADASRHPARGPTGRRFKMLLVMIRDAKAT